MIRGAVGVERIMRNSLSRIVFLSGMLVFVAILMVIPAAAGDIVLNNNSGDGNAVFYIEDEPSVVINGFDLTPLGVTLPVALDAVSISVQTTAPGSIDLLVYQDGNGGSPIDATLVYQEQISIGLTGVNRIELSEPAIITAPVVWVGFNLPVGFEFHADTSGSAVLTYWAWTAGGTFDLSALSSAGVLGPGDGSEPVNIAMEGIARITAELRAAETQEVAAGVPLGRQIYTDVAQDTSIMRRYDNCSELLYDPADIEISAGSAFSVDCVVQGEFHAPAALAQPQGQELFMQRKGSLFKLSAQIPPDLRKGGAVSTLPVPVTHCMRVPAGDLERAVIGEVRAQFQPKPEPEKWVILPSVRFNDLVCAEVTVANYIAYFVPETAESPQNVNLVLGWTQVHPHPLYCGIDASVQAPVVNTGQDWFNTEDGHITLTIQDIHVSSTIVVAERRHEIVNSLLGPGARQFFELGPINVDSYINDLHRLQVFVDHGDEVDEINEADNIWVTEYVLSYPPGRDECGPPSLDWKFQGCDFEFEEEYEGDDPRMAEALEDLEDGVHFPAKFDGSESVPVFVDYLLRAISSSDWEYAEMWFFEPRRDIAEVLAEAMVRHSGAIKSAACRE